MGIGECLSFAELRCSARGYEAAHKCVIDMCSDFRRKNYQSNFWELQHLVFISVEPGSSS